jgi:hypothetical protein
LDKTVKFQLQKPTISLLLKLLIKNYTIEVLESGGYKEHVIKVIYLSDVYKICLFHFGDLNETHLKTIFGTIGSFGFFVFYDFIL